MCAQSNPTLCDPLDGRIFQARILEWVAISCSTESSRVRVAQTVKCLPAIQATGVRSLAQEDPLEKEMATHSSTLAWKIPWTEESCRLQSMGSQRVGHD